MSVVAGAPRSSRFLRHLLPGLLLQPLGRARLADQRVKLRVSDGLHGKIHVEFRPVEVVRMEQWVSSANEVLLPVLPDFILVLPNQAENRPDTSRTQAIILRCLGRRVQPVLQKNNYAQGLSAYRTGSSTRTPHRRTHRDCRPTRGSTTCLPRSRSSRCGRGCPPPWRSPPRWERTRGPRSRRRARRSYG